MEDNAYINSFRARLNKDGVKLLDDFVRNHTNPQELRYAVEFEFKRLQKQYPVLPMRFINFDTFSSLNHLPRYPDEDVTTSLESIDRSCSLLVFISHCWLRGHEGTEGWDGKAHPDNVNGDKYMLCKTGIKRLWSTLAVRAKQCYIWLDFGCMNQNDKERLNDELEHYDRIIQYCDCLFTPIVDPHHESWDYLSLEANLFKNYCAKSWIVGPDAYLNRGWCRVEMMYAAVLPVLPDNSSRKRHELFDAGLSLHCSENRRPHFLFGTKELSRSQPILLPPLQHSYFRLYHPLVGHLSVATDIDYIRILIDELMPYMTEIKAGYTGDTDDSGQKHGHGVMVYDNGDVYEGRWYNNKRCGQGNFRCSNGDFYEGEWIDDKKHGEGRWRISTGEYVGDFEYGLPCGTGTITFLDRTVASGDWVEGKLTGAGFSMNLHGDVYEGEWKNGQQHGLGSFRFNNGAMYQGEWKNDHEHGHGRIRTGSGSVFEGEWRDGQIQGFCTFRLSNGVLYEGHVLNDLLHGSGKYTYKNGDVYDGEWFQGYRHGYGKLICASGDVYEGNWLNNKKHGQGTFRFIHESKFDEEWRYCRRNGRGYRHESLFSEYTGSWKHDKMHGSGIYKYGNGDVYEGNWVNNKKHGHGIFRFLDESEFVGEFRHGLKHGHGTFCHCNGDEYSGDWVQDMMQGIGMYKYRNGDVYSGNWIDDRKHGSGIYRFSDGSEYDGEWECGLKHGHGFFRGLNGVGYSGAWCYDTIQGFGTYKYENGDEYVGQWMNNQRHGPGTLEYADGSKKEGEWIHDMFEYELVYLHFSSDDIEDCRPIVEGRGLRRVWTMITRYFRCSSSNR